jgi:FixJ family two-component response regulator
MIMNSFSNDPQVSSGALGNDRNSSAGSTDRSQLIHILSEDPVLKNQLSGVLKTCGFRESSHDSPTQFLNEIADLEKGVLIVDHFMLQMTGLEVIGKINSSDLPIPVILLISQPRVNIAVAAIKLGAFTVLCHPLERSDILTAIKEATASLPFRRSSANSMLPPRRSSGDTWLDLLTPRELQVVELVYDGATNKAISITLDISIKTVERHRSNAMRKLEVNSVAALIRLFERERRVVEHSSVTSH